MIAVNVIASDEEAVEVARSWAARWLEGRSSETVSASLPWAELEALVNSGLLGITVPRRFGGADVSAVTLAEVVRLLSAGDSNIGQIPQSHFTFLHALRLLGTEDQQGHFFGEALAGRLFGNAQAERGSSEGRSLFHPPNVHGEGMFVLDGRKSYCTGALFAIGSRSSPAVRTTAATWCLCRPMRRALEGHRRLGWYGPKGHGQRHGRARRCASCRQTM